MKKHIPNAITCANLFSGCLAVVFAFHGDLKAAAYLVLLAGIFDFFDGMVARALHVKSEIGKQLDSLADMVSFGLVPGVVLYHLFLQSDANNINLAYFGFLVTVFSALRLAKFNIDTRQTEDFIGLNTPMNTLFVVSLPFIKEQYPEIINNSILLIITTIVLSILLVSEIKIFSFKLSNLTWNSNKYKFIFLILSIVLISFLKFVATPFILVLYIILSILHFKKTT